MFESADAYNEADSCGMITKFGTSTRARFASRGGELVLAVAAAATKSTWEDVCTPKSAPWEGWIPLVVAASRSAIIVVCADASAGLRRSER